MRSERNLVPLVIILLVISLAAVLSLLTIGINNTTSSRSDNRTALTTYINQDENIKLQHPKHWEVHENTHEGAIVLTNYDYLRQSDNELSENHVKVVIKEEINPDKLSPHQWLEQKVTPTTEILKTETISIEGTPAVKTQIQASKSIEAHVVHISRGNSMYILSSTNQKSDSLDQLIDSLSFTDEVTAKNNQSTQSAPQEQDRDQEQSKQAPEPKESSVNEPKTQEATLPEAVAPSKIIELHKEITLPNTFELKEAPPITGDSSADDRIQNIAASSGYTLQSITNSELVNLEGSLVQPSVIKSWHAMKEAAKKEAGSEIVIIKGYQSVEDQKDTFLNSLAKDNRKNNSRKFSVQEITDGKADSVIKNSIKTTPPPGYTKHHNGYAVSITDTSAKSKSKKLKKTAGYKWMTEDNHRNALRFGFIPNYPEQDKHAEALEYVWVGEDEVSKNQ